MAPATTPDRPPEASSEARRFTRTAARFLLIAAAIYLALYVGTERLVYRYAHRNRFFAVRSAPPSRYDFVVLGASHAAVFDYRDMNQRLEQMTGARIINLSVVGGGVTVNRLLFDYFLTRHQTGGLVYVVDSFAFLSRQWNEERLSDRRLFVRAPFDPSLVRLLLIAPGGWPVGLDYRAGSRKSTTLTDSPLMCRPTKARDSIGDTGQCHSWTTNGSRTFIRRSWIPRRSNGTWRLEALVALAHERGIMTIAIKPPLPQRIYRRLPFEREFDTALAAVVARQQRRVARLLRSQQRRCVVSGYRPPESIRCAGVLQRNVVAAAPRSSAPRR